jgi:fibronectin type 3 domain-containing protein
LAVPVAAALAVTAALAVAAPARAAEDTTPPTAPGPIQIAEITETTIRLTWTPSTDDVGVVSYEVNQAFTDVVLRRTTPTNEIFYNGLQRSRSYGFSVVALDAAGNRSPGVYLRVVMPPGDDQPPTRPGAPTATQLGQTSVTLTWAPSTDNVLLVQYQVLRITGTGTAVVGIVFLQPPAFPTSTHRLSNLTPGTTYTFAVRALDEAGNASADSPPVTVTTPGPDTTAPTAPGTPTASEVGPNSIRLSWAPATDDVAVTRYVVFDLAADGGPTQLIGTDQTSGEVGTTPGRRHVFVVYAEDAAGNRSPASGQLVVTSPNGLRCAVDYRIVTQWAGGFSVELTLRNTGSTAIEDWTLGWGFEAGQRITHLWGGELVPTAEPLVRVRALSWNRRIVPGGAIRIGFVGTWQGSNPVPAAMVVNGVSCEG